MGRWDKRLIDQVSDVPSITFFFHKILPNSLQKPFHFFSFFDKITEIKIKSFECPKSIRNYEKKKIMLGTSDNWSISHPSHQPSDPVYYIEY